MDKDFSKASPIVVLDYFLLTGLLAIESKRSAPFKVCLFDNARLAPGCGTGSKPPNATSLADDSEPLMECERDAPPRNL